MRLQIEIPPLEDIVSKGCRIPLAPRGLKWTSECLGVAGRAVGVYAIHHKGELKYVGKTNGPTMSFATRLRREFQENASGGKHIYPKLASLSTPPDVMVTLFPEEQIENLVTVEGSTIAPWQKIEIFEIAMVQVLCPTLQAHQIMRWAKFINRRLSPEEWTSAQSKLTPEQS